ncbi:flagellar hook-basal body complex protein [Frigidibacter sp. MR17.24]|uniref:flagellar hook-basal body complex protein n=1 Tax=Frigidibacter sp. MR17.24 TaxID=3127345 RepID=UPI003012E912
MDNAVYALLNRQAGLLHEFEVVANNIANASTTGFRREGVIFAEHVRALEKVEPDLALADAAGRVIDLVQAPLKRTGGTMDFAIEGEGFFQVGTPEGIQLTRAGAFVLNDAGDVVLADGSRLLDAGGAPVSVPLGAGQLTLAPDGTLSGSAGPIAQLGLVMPADPIGLRHTAGTRFAVEGGTVPAENGRMLQGFVEGSNVDAVTEVARMIEVQRGYELGQTLLGREDERIRAVVSTLGS